jgi:hypothetical protein
MGLLSTLGACSFVYSFIHFFIGIIFYIKRPKAPPKSKRRTTSCLK